MHRQIVACITSTPEGEGLPAPAYQTRQAAGVDLHAALDETLVLAPGAYGLIPCGFRMALEPGYEAQIRPRSGLALKHGITVLNSPGTIDSDYRGPIGVILINHGAEPFEIKRGDRIAQMVIAPVTQVGFDVLTNGEFKSLCEKSPTDRGTCGFGSTGV